MNLKDVVTRVAASEKPTVFCDECGTVRSEGEPCEVCESKVDTPALMVLREHQSTLDALRRLLMKVEGKEEADQEGLRNAIHALDGILGTESEQEQEEGASVAMQ